MGGERPESRHVVIPPESVLVDSTLDVHTETGALYRTVSIEGPLGIGTVELSVPVELAAELAAVFVGRPVRSTPAAAEEWIRATVHAAALVVEAEASRPRPALYRVEGGPEFGDMVIEVPAAVTNPGLIATHLQERLAALTRPLIDAEHGIDWMVYLPDVTPTGPTEGFASLSIDGYPAVRYPLVEASRTEIGGAS